MGAVEKLIASIRTVLDFLLLHIANLFYPTKKSCLPPIKESVLMEPAVVIADKIRNGKLKAVDVVRAYIKRIEEVNPLINAVVKLNDAAIDEAKEIDEKVELELRGYVPEGGISIINLPLLGIPFCCKETVGVKGMPFTAGLVARAGEVASEDAPVIRNLKANGAIFIGVTNIPELQYWWVSDNKLYGRTNNPYDLSRIPGGSSGGEGAIVSSAGTAIGVGTDIAGSLRIPAACCGIFGHHVSPSVFPAEGMVPLIDRGALTARMFSFGPMCRYSIDIKPMLKAMAGSYISKLPKIDDLVDLKKLKIYYMIEDGDPIKTPVQHEIKDAINKIVSHFEDKYSVKAEKVHFEKMKRAFFMVLATMKEANAPRLASVLNNGSEINVIYELLKCLLRCSEHMLGTLSFAATEKYFPSKETQFTQNFLKVRDELKKQFYELLGEDGIFLYPSHPEGAPKHGTSVLKSPNVGYTSIFNVLSVPVTTCPVGLNGDGLPIGVQVVAKQFNDHLTIAVAQEIEKLFGGWVPPCIVDC
ncbi:fatty-acid amide hydrolase 2-like protein [Dinothrombium tinctorium]|uniref:Fatty-acid amide hydrolase 2-like protein n=1 Tax=Dinothrombium tinctorium TaxID=1965070 RepID=A0A3S3NVE0_9ACAR|nr:fatty-acid amide hydrolase 2-like protein [Dinothrombium tinctorium]